MSSLALDVETSFQVLWPIYFISKITFQLVVYHKFHVLYSQPQWHCLTLAFEVAGMAV